ncbi:MAG: hypothetical protein U5L02_04825 [Rheinheimera sp.]|nr:hypothetical protein [Rheinheimera sp.]
MMATVQLNPTVLTHHPSERRKDFANTSLIIRGDGHHAAIASSTLFLTENHHG